MFCHAIVHCGVSSDGTGKINKLVIRVTKRVELYHESNMIKQ